MEQGHFFLLRLFEHLAHNYCNSKGIPYKYTHASTHLHPKNATLGEGQRTLRDGDADEKDNQMTAEECRSA